MYIFSDFNVYFTSKEKSKNSVIYLKELQNLSNLKCQILMKGK